MMRKKGFIPVGVLMNPYVILAVLAVVVGGFLVHNSGVSLPTLEVFGDDPLACELDRSCCLDTTIDGICIRNDADASMPSPFQWKDLQLIDVNDADLFHYPGSLFMINNVDHYPSSAGLGRWKYGNYGFLAEGWGTHAGGSISKKAWYPTKLQSVGHTFSVFPSYYESEVTGDLNFFVTRIFVKSRIDGEAPFGIKNVKYGRGAVWRTDIDGQYCGFEETFDLPGDSRNPGRALTFLFVVDECPDRYDVSQRFVYYDIAKDEVRESIFAITTKDHESEVSDWLGNYQEKELSIRLEYESFAREIYHPSKFGSFSDADKKAYYLNDYSNWANLMFSHSGSSDDLFHGNIFFIPALTAYVDGTWKWDSFWSAYANLGVVKDMSGRRIEAIQQQVDIWRQNTKAFPVVEKWPRQIHSLSYNGEQPQGGWTLALWDYYKKTGDKELLCAMEPKIRSDYEAYKLNRGDNWLMRCEHTGRDGTDTQVCYEMKDDVTTTSWFLLDAIALANIEKECGNDAVADQYFDDFNNIRNDIGLFWNDAAQFYVSIDDDGGSYLKDGDINSYNSNPNVCWFLGFDAVPESKIQPMVDTLFSDFVDVVGLTSISTTHKCYTSNGGRASGCFAGGTWDGPVWAGTDNTQCLWALRQQVEVYGRTYLQDELDALEEMTLRVAKQHPFGAESYNADGSSNPAVWGNRPYGWGALVATNAMSGYNPLATLEIPVFEVPVCEPSAEVCDGLDNDCDGTVDETCSCVNGQTTQCGTTDIGVCSYGTQTCSGGQWGSCSGNVEPVQELDDGLDNDCDGSVDEDFSPGYTDSGVLSWIWDHSVGWIIDFVIQILDGIRSRV